MTPQIDRLPPSPQRRDTGELAARPSPPNVLERTCVDVGFLAGMPVDKFRWHLPLHRQHQRLADLSDGYATYAVYATRHGIANAHFTDAEESDPAGVSEALSLIGALHAAEKAIRKKKLKGPAKLAHRRERSAPAVDAFFTWCKAQRQRLDLLPSSPFAQALQYAAAREPGLRVFLEDPAVSVDTIWKGDFARYRRGGATGCSRGRSWAPNRWASSRACSPPAGCRTSMPTPIWSTYSSSSAGTPRSAPSSPRRGCG